MKIRKATTPGLMYNDQQKSVINTDDGAFIVSAGPGSGKTRVVTTRIARLVNSGIDTQSILATTFTKKAAGEMNERLEQDGIDTSRMAVQTMHSFCYRVMRESRRWPDWEIDATDRLNLLIKQATGWKGMKWRGVDITLVGSFISLAKNNLLRPDQCPDWPALQEDPFYGDRRYSQAYFEVEELRKQRKLITFDDMLIDGVTVLEHDESLCARYQQQFDYVIIDEFQDSNVAQIRLMELLAAPQWNLMCVGDVDQAIYEWRGAKPQFMVDFAKKYDARIISMGVNYRCAPNIMDMAAQCIEHNEARITKDLSANKTINATIHCRELCDLDTEADTVADEVEQLRADEVSLGEMFVLYRTNAQSRAVEEVFCRRKIPHVVLGGASFYQRKEVQDLLAYLRIMHEPKNIQAGLRAINRPFRYIGKAILEDIERTAESRDLTFLDAAAKVFDASSNRGIGEFLDIMKHLDAQCIEEDADRPGDLISVIVKRTNYITYLASNEGSDTAENSRVANVGEVIRSADRFDTIRDFLTFVDWQIKQRKKKNKAKEAVQCMTIHKAKGLEALVVFLIGVNEGILPHAKCTGECEEERRLYYVGVTRAMDYLHISCVQNLGMEGHGALEPSRFIEESGLTIESLTPDEDSATVADPAGGQQDEDTE